MKKKTHWKQVKTSAAIQICLLGKKKFKFILEISTLVIYGAIFA